MTPGARARRQAQLTRVEEAGDVLLREIAALSKIDEDLANGAAAAMFATLGEALGVPVTFHFGHPVHLN